MACCENTYNLGCFDSCAVVTLPILFPSDGQYTLFFNGTNNIKYKVVGVSGEPFIVDATLLNSDSTYTFYVVNNSGVRVVFDIDGVDYDCFKIKIETYFNIDATDEITPSVPCTLMCQETYDPTGVGADAFNYNNLHTKAVSDGITITGDGTAGNPFVAVGGGLTCADLPTCPIIISMANDIANKSDIGHTHTFASLTSKPTTLAGYGITDAYPLVGNPSAFIDATALLPYLTIASASATYQPILVSGTNIKTINGSSVLGAGDLTISGLPPQGGNNGKYLQTDGTNASWQNVSANVPINTILSATGTNTINNAAYAQEWQWNSLSSGIGLKLSSSSTGATSNTQTVFAINQTGANATAGQTTYGALFSNTKTGTSSTNIAAKFSASGATNNYAAIFENGNVGIGTASPGAKLDIRGSGDFLGLQVGNGTVGTLFQIYGGKAGFVGFNGGAYNNLDIRCGALTQLFLSTNGNVGIADANPTQRLSLNGALCFSGVSAPSDNVAIYAPEPYTLGFMTNNVERMRINGNGNVGIGTTSPSASALLDLTSTTKGFLPPRMTATQASAVTSPAEGLILYVTDTNGTFATKGWYGFDGATWNKLN